MWLHVVQYKFKTVSEEYISAIFSVEQYAEQASSE
jgi:hypothetical protein